jgi:molybdopterin/thiamine biosynthesis adenylyltransferase
MQNPIGAMGSACFGSAEVFKRLLEIHGCTKKWVKFHPEDFQYSFLDYSTSSINLKFPYKIDLNEKILLVGAGAVGSGFIYALSHIKNVYGEIVVLDKDEFTGSNLNRCLTCFTDDIGNNKALHAERYSNENLKIRGFRLKFDEFKMERLEFPIMVSTVDNNQARYDIQSSLPKLIFHGATGKNISAVSIIKFLENACLCCIFKTNHSYFDIIAHESGIPSAEVERAIKEKSVFTKEHYLYVEKTSGKEITRLKDSIGLPFEQVYAQEICGKMDFQLKDKEISSSVSFVSFFSGLVLLTELIKYQDKTLQNYPMMSKNNFLQFNLFLFDNYNLANRVKDSHCSLNCNDKDVRNIFSRKWSAVEA